MKTLTQTETQVLTNEILFDLIANVGSTICSIEYIVDDRRSKTKNKEYQVQKQVACKNVYLCHDYSKKVINLTGNTEFVALPLKGKERVTPTILRSLTTSALMLDGKILYSETTKILGFFHDGEAISEMDAIANEYWGNTYFNPKEKTTMGRGEVSDEDDFYIINPSFEKIVYIKIGGQQYRR